MYLFPLELETGIEPNKNPYVIAKRTEPNEPSAFAASSRSYAIDNNNNILNNNNNNCLTDGTRTEPNCQTGRTEPNSNTTLSERRARMLPETLEKLMFLRYNM